MKLWQIIVKTFSHRPEFVSEEREFFIRDINEQGAIAKAVILIDPEFFRIKNIQEVKLKEEEL